MTANQLGKRKSTSNTRANNDPSRSTNQPRKRKRAADKVDESLRVSKQRKGANDSANSNLAPRNESPSSAALARLSKSAALEAADIVFDKLNIANLLGANCSGNNGPVAAFADESTRIASHSLWSCVVKRLVLTRVESEMVQRKLLPITINSLCTLFVDGLHSITAPRV
jgi:hypothetical protein